MGDGWLNYPVLGNEVWRYGAVFFLLLGALVFYGLSRVLLARLSPPGREEMGRCSTSSSVSYGGSSRF